MAKTAGEGTAKRGLRWALWVAAFLLMVAAAVHQRRTGPTHPFRGAVALDGETISFRLPRSAVSGHDAVLSVAAPAGVEGTLRWRRLRSDDDWHETELAREGERLSGALPTQPPAGKVEYRLLLGSPRGEASIPAAGEEAIVLRFRGAVPAWLLLPHVLTMFVAMLVAVRAGLGALFAAAGTARLARWALGGITLGGMILGPLVQQRAFGALWTGWPLGGDLTDNKTLVMWLAWIVAVLAVRPGAGERRPWARLLLAAATVVTLAVYLVPHSLRGSELDFRALEGGVSPTEAVRTGRPEAPR